MRFAAMMPAMRADARTSPLGVSRCAERRNVSRRMCTTAEATARRSVTGLAPTSTILASPASVRWVDSASTGGTVSSGISSRDWRRKGCSGGDITDVWNGGGLSGGRSELGSGRTSSPRPGVGLVIAPLIAPEEARVEGAAGRQRLDRTAHAREASARPAG